MPNPCSLVRISPVVVALAATVPTLAHADAPLWGPHIDIEAKPGSKRTLGEADLLLPVSQDARTLVFANLRARSDNKSSYEGNLGAGVRRMYENGWNFGAYGYWDRRRSANHNFFDQATLGVEALGRDWDFRANGYLPFGTRAYAFAPESTAAISGASIQVTTTTREERALKGFDAEIGWRAPIFDSEAARQLRLYVGGSRFSDAGKIVEGPRLRAELALDELTWFGKGTRLFLSAELQDDNARGGQTFLGVRLRIPLGKESASVRTLTAQERRMTAPVMRDVDIVIQDRIASTLVESATTTSSGQSVTVVDSSTTSGAALQGALNTAGANSTVILSGTFNTTGTTTLQSGQTVLGAGTLSVRSPSGRTAAVTLPGGTLASTTADLGTFVSMAPSSTLSGMTISVNSTNPGTNLYGIVANNADGAVISNNNISMTATNNGVQGIRVENGSTNVVVSGNTVTTLNTNGGGGTATGLYVSGSSVTVTGNSLSATAVNKYSVYLDNATINAGSTGNVSASGSCGLGFVANTGSINFTNGTHCP